MLHTLIRFQIYALCFVSVALAAACGQELSDTAAASSFLAPHPESQSQPIIRGTPMGRNDFAAVGGLVKTDSHGTALNLCTGALIAPDVVLTAAHCLVPAKAGDDAWQMWFSSHYDLRQSDERNYIRVAHTVMHPDFSSGAQLDAPLAWREARNDAEAQILAQLAVLCGDIPEQHVTNLAFWQCVTNLPAPMQRALGMMDSVFYMADVALVILDKPASSASLARLPTAVTAPLYAKQQMHAVGYGDFGTDSASCEYGLRHQGMVTLDGIGQFALQVGFADGQVANGDSGGPLFAAGDAAMEIVGIASRSFVDLKQRVQGPTLYSKTQPYTPWIRKVLRDACRDGLRSAKMCKYHPF